MPSRALRPCAQPGCAELVASGYCDAHRKTEGYQWNRGNSNSRGYGYRWRKARETWLKEHPLCSDPHGFHQDRATIATVVDHIRPHQGNDELFWDRNNWQSLCKSCHDYKTAVEDGGGWCAAASFVTIVWGPPGARKSTYVKQHRRPEDMVWDFDAVLETIGGNRDTAVGFVLAMRDAFFTRLESSRLKSHVWVIAGLPKRNERNDLKARLKARAIFVQSDLENCKRRMIESQRDPAIVDKWFANYEPDRNGKTA